MTFGDTITNSFFTSSLPRSALFFSHLDATKMCLLFCFVFVFCVRDSAANTPLRWILLNALCKVTFIENHTRIERSKYIRKQKIAQNKNEESINLSDERLVLSLLKRQTLKTIPPATLFVWDFCLFIFSLPSVCTHSLGQRSFSYAASSVWNGFPCKITSSNTLTSLKCEGRG